MLTSAPASALDGTLWESKVGPFYSRAMVLDLDGLTEVKLRSLYPKLSKELKENRAWTVDLFVDQHDAAREFSGKMVTDKGYDWWLRLYNEFGQNLLPMAEILAYGDNGVLRIRDKSGVCTESVLSGDNFLRIHLGANDFEILKVYYRSLPPHTDATYGDEATIWVYVRASAFPPPEKAREFSMLMQKRFQQKRIAVVFRTDAYFLTDLMFPVVYRFDPKPAPPSQKQYEQSKTMYCFCDRPGIQCR